jgi:hypothetical protein
MAQKVLVVNAIGTKAAGDYQVGPRAPLSKT